jgi:hypothetical protein
MKHVGVQFNTRTYGVKSSTKELRRRYKQSEGFKRLLHAAAAAQLKGDPVTLRGSNPKATRALERAVCGVRRTMEIDANGHAARPAYLMRNGKTWTEVHKASAVKAMKATTPDTLGVMSVWVYSPTISHRAAARLVARTAPECISTMLEEAATIEFKENRARNTDKRGDNAQTESAELAPWEEETAAYNDAGVLETPNERQEREKNERKTKEQQGIRIARERAAAEGHEFTPPSTRREAPKLAPMYHEYIHAWERTTAPAPAPVTKELPAAPYYHATKEKMQKANRAAWETLSDERAAHQQRRAVLDDDENEQLELAELDAELSPDDLEADMLPAWEAMERYAAAQ